VAKERWGSKLGVIMAVAGSAIGLGNFLRFPGLAANNGGGAFMVPYFVALLLLGLPLMWIEWTIGRFGGGFGHSTAPGMFHTLATKTRFIKYFGVIGIFGPIVIFVYYTYIESWLLGYSFFALTGQYARCTTKESMSAFLSSYCGADKSYFANIGTAYVFFLITFALNVLVVAGGIRGGIQRLCEWSMPVLFVLGIVLVVRVFTLGTPDPAHPENNVASGLGFLWNPDWSKLADAKVWLAAAGQIFFTLSVGIGVILTYASYLEKKDDVALSGLTAAAANEVAEVVLGGSIVVPAAIAFFGVTAAAGNKSIFELGFITMPLVLDKLPLGNLFGFAWFLLLFLAGITSSISLAQPAIAFLEDEFGLTKREAAAVFAVVTFVLCQASIFGFSYGVIDELDFWGANVCLVLFGTIETILFGWVFGMDKAWTELHTGADITIPRIYRFIIKYVTPLVLLAILGFWLVQDWVPTMLMTEARKGSPQNVPYLLATRIGLLTLFALLALMVKIAWRKRRERGELA
jgi:SNF family Na+-dependent transporter